MLSNRDQNFIAFCAELRTHVEEHHHFPNKHTAALNRIKYIRKKINEGTLEEWKRVMFMEIAEMRDMAEHTGGRTRKSPLSDEGEDGYEILAVRVLYEILDDLLATASFAE